MEKAQKYISLSTSSGGKTDRYRGMKKSAAADVVVPLGFNAYGIDRSLELEDMYIVIVTMDISNSATNEETEKFSTTFQRDKFLAVASEGTLLFAIFFLSTISFWQKQRWKADRVESYLIGQAKRGVDYNLISGALASFGQWLKVQC